VPHSPSAMPFRFSHRGAPAGGHHTSHVAHTFALTSLPPDAHARAHQYMGPEASIMHRLSARMRRNPGGPGGPSGATAAASGVVRASAALFTHCHAPVPAHTRGHATCIQPLLIGDAAHGACLAPNSLRTCIIAWRGAHRRRRRPNGPPSEAAGPLALWAPGRPRHGAGGLASFGLRDGGGDARR
jgi:hypothetical protein